MEFFDIRVADRTAPEKTADNPASHDCVSFFRLQLRSIIDCSNLEREVNYRLNE
jgi:hypothetical protein